ncbi:MAG: response regulator transcription factor [Verrucomicrobiae bacterium]|nr:response regulator transcription factor [Verrucomicrobiae bacterium]
MKHRAIIVDDEALGRERMRMLLEEFPSVSICAECAGGLQAVEKIQEVRPDIVFLDIQMPDLDGFGVMTELHSLAVPAPVVIFVTAYNEHAVKAFEVNAIDYLLKPVQADRLGKAIERAETMLAKPDQEKWQASLTEMLAAMRPGNNHLQRIEIRSQGRTDYVSVDEVYWLQADGNYIEVHTETQTHLARMTLAELERQLDPNVFLRVSRSDVVNLTRVTSIQSVGRRGHVAVLEDGREVPLKRALEELQGRLKYAR